MFTKHTIQSQKVSQTRQSGLLYMTTSLLYIYQCFIPYYCFSLKYKGNPFFAISKKIKSSCHHRDKITNCSTGYAHYSTVLILNNTETLNRIFCLMIHFIQDVRDSTKHKYFFSIFYNKCAFYINFI